MRQLRRFSALILAVLCLSAIPACNITQGRADLSAVTDKAISQLGGEAEAAQAFARAKLPKAAEVGYSGIGTFTATLRNAENVSFPDALKGDYAGGKMNISGGFSEENVVTGDTSFRGELKRR